MSHSSKLCPGAEAVKKFKKAGQKIDRQKGSHVMMVKDDYEYTLSIPLQKELGIGILQRLIKHAGISTDEFNRLQRKESTDLNTAFLTQFVFTLYF